MKEKEEMPYVVNRMLEIEEVSGVWEDTSPHGSSNWALFTPDGRVFNEYEYFDTKEKAEARREKLIDNNLQCLKRELKDLKDSFESKVNELKSEIKRVESQIETYEIIKKKFI